MEAAQRPDIDPRHSAVDTQLHRCSAVDNHWHAHTRLAHTQHQAVRAVVGQPEGRQPCNRVHDGRHGVSDVGATDR